MKITYDTDANAAYIQIVGSVGAGEATQQIHSIETPGGKGEIILDFDMDGRLLGLELLNAREILPERVIQDSLEPGGRTSP
ncbi:DUF2283 domain-containing protein [Frigoribacterium salinisoli]